MNYPTMPPPMPPPMQQPMPPPMTAIPRNFFRKNLVMIFVLLGITMFFVGLMILSSTAFLKQPTDQNALQSYEDTLRNMGGAGRVVMEIGGLLACIGLVCGGIAADDVSDKIRAVMVSAGVAVIIATLVVLGLFSGLSTL